MSTPTPTQISICILKLYSFMSIRFFHPSGPVKKKRIPDEETNRVTAFHEAGHAIVAYFSKDATSPHKITIMPRGQALGHVSSLTFKK